MNEKNTMPATITKGDWISDFLNDDSSLLGRHLPGWFKHNRPYDIVGHSHTDVYESGAQLVFETELPGLNKDDIKIRIENDTLIISGEIKRDESVREDKYFALGRR